MAYYNGNKTSTINKQIKKFKLKLEKLEALEHPSMWDKITIRLTTLEVVSLKEILQKAIDTIYHL